MTRLYMYGVSGLVALLLVVGLYYQIRANGKLRAELAQTQENLETFANGYLHNEEQVEKYQHKLKEQEKRNESISIALTDALRSNVEWANQPVPDAVINSLRGENQTYQTQPAAGVSTD